MNRADKARNKFEESKRRKLLRVLIFVILLLTTIGAALIVFGVVYEQFFNGSETVAAAIMSPLELVCSGWLAGVATYFAVKHQLVSVLKELRDIWK